MTEPDRRRKVSGGAHPGCMRWGRAFGAARWEHPPRPSLRTLILPGGRRRPGGAASSPAPSVGSRLVAGLWATTVAGEEGRWRTGPRRGVLLVTLRLAGYELWGEPPAWGEPASRRGGSRPAPSRAQEGGREHPRRGRRPPHRPAVERARKLLSATRWTNFSEFWGFAFSSHPERHRRARRVGETDGARGQGVLKTRATAPPPQAQLPAPPPRSRSLRKLRP